jgi:hypothetical protein
MKEEIDAHEKNHTWTIVERTKDMNVIGSKWVFKKKKNECGELLRYKARLVAKGYDQVEGIDYTETFAPTLKYKSLRIILVLSASTHRRIVQLDIKTAFLNASVNEDIYVQPPEGMQVKSTCVLKLNKALYGIKQAPHEWNVNIHTFLISIGFTSCIKDTCIYIKVSKTNHTFILGLFVDDMVVSYNENDEQEWQLIKTTLKNKYDLSDISVAHHVLGMKINKSESGTISLDQQVYIGEKIQQFRMSECDIVSVPGDVNITINNNNKNEDITLYRSIVGSLIHAAKSTRPDIEHAVNMVARYMSNPLTSHMNAARKILRYLRGSMNYGLVYMNRIGSINDSVQITGYSDADWAGDKSDRKSTTGYCVFINGNIVSWCTKKQQTVALSTMEAEYMALTEVTKEIMWMNMLLTEMKVKVQTPMIVYCDNQPTIQSSNNDVHHDRTKHIDTRYYFVRDLIHNNTIKVVWINSHSQIADIFTKPLAAQLFQHHRSSLVQTVS